MLVATIAFLAALWFFPNEILPPVAHYLDVSEPPQHTDYILVLNGDPNTRPFAAAALVNAGYAKEVLLTRQRLTLESPTVQDGLMLSELAILKRVLAHQGVADSAVQVLPDTIGSTWEEVTRLKEFLDEHPDATVTVVTNGFHTRRARSMFAKQLGTKVSQIHMLGVPRDFVDEDAWWQTCHGCNIYISEFAKCLYYGLRN